MRERLIWRWVWICRVLGGHSRKELFFREQGKIKVFEGERKSGFLGIETKKTIHFNNWDLWLMLFWAMIFIYLWRNVKVKYVMIWEQEHSSRLTRMTKDNEFAWSLTQLSSQAGVTHTSFFFSFFFFCEWLIICMEYGH